MPNENAQADPANEAGAANRTDAANRAGTVKKPEGAPAKPREADTEVIFQQKGDRRLLSFVPDKSGTRSNRSRRGGANETQDVAFEVYEDDVKKGLRYLVDYPIEVQVSGKRNYTVEGRVLDISTTGLLIQIDKSKDEGREVYLQGDLLLTFEITPGSMPEGYEMKVKKMPAVLVRRFEREDGNLYGVQFKRTLAEYAASKRQDYMLVIASVFGLLVSGIIALMRTESVLYFQFNRWLYLYSIIAASFLLTRYLFASFYRPMKIDPDFTPGVTIIIPCFNEEEWIDRTILSCINQDYPTESLEVIVVDDCSNDNSWARVNETIRMIRDADTNTGAYHVSERLRCVQQPENMGKRDAMACGARLAKHDLLVFVDSDSFLDPFAVRNIVQPFKDKEMGGVSGRTDVANTYTNSLTKMQAVRYSIAFRIMKAAEGVFDAATCLSGPLSCYRKDLVLRYMDAWLGQTFLGQKATFGDDRSMTNFILRHNRTAYQDTAVCMTIVPKSYDVFLKQQMRWKRSWLRESLIAARYMWRKEPFMSLGFYMGLAVPIAAPIIVIYNLIYVPVMHRVFPVTFLTGMLMMALLMSLAQLFLRRSTTWIYGLWFCIYYEAVLLWQMPVAWVTFWKSTWGTRMTKADLEEQEKKEKKEQAKRERHHAGQGSVG